MIKRIVINENNSADVRGIDENEKECFYLDTNHSLEVLLKSAQAQNFLTVPYSVQVLKPKPVVVPVPKPEPEPIPTPIPQPTPNPKTIQHTWKNGDDNSVLPTVSLLPNGHYLIKSDGSVDCDGSQRVGSIDPVNGQSHTSLRRSNGWKGKFDYVDSEVVPFFVLPMNWVATTGDTKSHLGDIAKLTYKDKTIYAIYADQGPNALIGEASICAIEKLGGNPWNVDKTKVVRGIPFGVTYEVISGSANLARTIDFDSIQAYGKEMFEGGMPLPVPQPLPTPDTVRDFSVNFTHLKNVKADLSLTAENANKFWTALQTQIQDKTTFNTRVNLGVKPEYGNAQCATTTASVLEGAAIKAGLPTVAELFSKVHRDKDEFALTHQIEIMLKRLGFVMYAKATHTAPQGSIAMMAGRYDFAGCKQHSGHVYSIYEDKGIGQHDVICDNGGWNHVYLNDTESFFVPSCVVLEERGAPKPTPTNSKIKGKGILLNNGHPRKGAGAVSQNGKVDEYELNLFQCNRIKAALDKVGIPCKIINQTQYNGSLHDTGMQAEGYDAFIITHHNATLGAQYVVVLLGDNPKPASKEFGALLSSRIAKVLGFHDNGTNGDYVVSVTKAGDSTNCPIVCLTESYFIDSILDMDTAYKMSAKAADEISSAIIERFTSSF